MISPFSQQMSRRRLLSGVSVAAMGLAGAALVGCSEDEESSTPVSSTGSSGSSAASSGSTSTASASTSTASSGPVEVTFWSSFGARPYEQEFVDAFNASQEEVVVKYEHQGSYEETAQKLTAGLAGGTFPDVCLLSDVWWFKFYLAGELAELNDLATEVDLNTGDYVKSLYDEGVRKGKSYWIPMARSTPLFYYNKEAFSKAGFDAAPTTWDEFEAMAPEIMAKGGTQYAFAHPGSGSYIAWLFQCVIRQYNGRYSLDDFTITIDEDAAAEAGEFYRKTVQEGWASTPADLNAEFLTGTTAAMMASTGSLGALFEQATFEFGTALLPEKYAFNCCTGGAGMAVMNRTDDAKKLGAMKFIKYFTSTEKTAEWSQLSGYMPVRQSAVAEMQTFFAEKPQFKVAVDQLSKTQAQDTARVFIPNGDQIIGKGLEEITITDRPAKDAFASVAQILRDEAKPVLASLAAVEG